MRLFPPLSSLLALSLPLAAQGTNQRALTESYDPVSPELASVSAADLIAVNSVMLGGTGTPWTAASLGLPAGANVDAFSDGTDIIPLPGPAIPSPPLTCRRVVLEYTVDRASAGLPGSLVELEATGDGAASDTFRATWINGAGPGLDLASDFLEVTPRTSGVGAPPETDLDALSWLEIEDFPVYFSVDPPTALALGVSPADVLIAFGEGAAPSVHKSAASLGLVPGDDIDALSVHGDAGTIVISLTRSSPSVAPGMLYAETTAAGMAVAGPSPTTWVGPAPLGLDPTTDELNGGRISDPVSGPCLNGSQPHLVVPGWTHDTLLVQNTVGNIGHVVHVPPGVPTLLTTAPPPGNATLVFGVLGRPCEADQTALPGLFHGILSLNAFAPFFTLGALPPQTQLPALQPGFEFTFQGLNVELFTQQLFTTNAVTVRAQ